MVLICACFMGPLYHTLAPVSTALHFVVFSLPAGAEFPYIMLPGGGGGEGACP